MRLRSESKHLDQTNGHVQRLKESRERQKNNEDKQRRLAAHRASIRPNNFFQHASYDYHLAIARWYVANRPPVCSQFWNSPENENWWFNPLTSAFVRVNPSPPPAEDKPEKIWPRDCPLCQDRFCHLLCPYLKAKKKAKKGGETEKDGDEEQDIEKA
ncbi:hypothetical protein BT63DRAFT_455585 [Microthyrium microscopicum]|uniref:Uncharacterized protein n=1 Tax=Microthyrium microscopicum TaxID=703497 RepID=A0A6A6UBH6_9PEZI|nr:hypothetical protein BT63DRAFT_455585 [Microthyrium microscopicum]